MKWLILICVLFLLFILPVHGLEKEIPNNGYWWEALSDSFKLGFVVGIAEGYHASYAIFDALWEFRPTEDSLSNCLRVMRSYNQWLNILRYRTTEVTYGQMMDGIDKFYKDYRNKQIEVQSIMGLVKMQIEGKSQTEIDSVARDLRQLHSKEGQP